MLGVCCRTAGIVGLTGLAVLGCTRDADEAGGGQTPTITLRPADPASAAGRPVALTVEIRNTWNQRCLLTSAPMGALTVLGLTRDGTPLAPQLTTATFLNGFQNAVKDSLVEVAPGASVRFEYSGPDGTLDSFAADATGGAEVSRWPVAARGRYELTVGYLRPPLPGVPADPCQASGTTATATFTVGQP